MAQTMMYPGGYPYDRSSETYVPRQPRSNAESFGPKLRVTVVLIGPPGDGKSTLGNLLVRGTDASRAMPFRVSEDFNSVGAEVAHADFEYEGIFHRVIDTTGLFEGATNATERLASCAGLAPDGIDAFIFVIRKGRFTEEYFDQLRCFEESAGKGSLKRTVIVFSHCGRESNEQLLSRCRKSTNAHLREALQRTAGIVGVDCHTLSRASDDRAAVLASTAHICREHRDVPRLAPMDPVELRRQLAEMDSAIGRMSHERQDMLRAKLHGVRSGCASLEALRRALGEAKNHQSFDDGRQQESRALQDSVEEARRHAGAMKQVANNLVEREQGRSSTPDARLFACCTPTAACQSACAPCEGGVKEIIQDYNQKRQEDIQNKFAQADLIADLTAQNR